ncbi:MAG: hypothetical protein ACI4NL_01560 [Christensenellales bacterium]
MGKGELPYRRADDLCDWNKPPLPIPTAQISEPPFVPDRIKGIKKASRKGAVFARQLQTATAVQTAVAVLVSYPVI